MKKNVFTSVVMIAALSFLMGISSLTFAEDSANSVSETDQKVICPFQGEMRGMKNLNRGRGMALGTQNLTEEQIEKLKAERTAFQTATQDLRQELQSKRLALQSELVKKEPDVKKAKSLQKDISAMNADLAQKRVEHVLEMKKIAPNAGTGQFQQDSKGSGKGRGRRNQ